MCPCLKRIRLTGCFRYLSRLIPGRSIILNLGTSKYYAASALVELGCLRGKTFTLLVDYPHNNFCIERIV